jgi:hypothetical protein
VAVTALAAWAEWITNPSEQKLRNRKHAGLEHASPAFYLELGTFDREAAIEHFHGVKSLLEIEEAIARLPSEARRQLVQDMPALCPDAFPADGWETILRDTTPRPALTSLLDRLDSEYKQDPKNFSEMNEDSLRSKK